MGIKLNSIISLCFFFGNVFLFTSCSYLHKRDIYKNILATSQQKFSFKDNSGEFVMIQRSGLNSDHKKFITKKQIVLESDNNVNLEKGISISTLDTFSRKIYILRPEVSQHTIWLEGKQYFSQLKIDLPNKVIEVLLKSPEEKWNGKKSISIPKNLKVSCFFDQLIPCVKTTGFIEKAKDMKAGQMNFHIIWNAYPYFQEQYLNLPHNPISYATFDYGGITKDGEIRFNLHTANQTIHYFLDKELNLTKIFWIPQGLSILKVKEN